LMAMAVGAIELRVAGQIDLWQPNWLDPARGRFIVER
jgi:hypothetical protein